MKCLHYSKTECIHNSFSVETCPDHFVALTKCKTKVTGTAIFENL